MTANDWKQIPTGCWYRKLHGHDLEVRTSTTSSPPGSSGGRKEVSCWYRINNGPWKRSPHDNGIATCHGLQVLVDQMIMWAFLCPGSDGLND